MTARDKALLVLWHRFGEGYSLEEFSTLFNQEGGPPLADLRRVLDKVTADIESGERHFCPVCETIHPPLQDGRGLMLPKDKDQARRVLDAHIRDEVNRAGAMSFGDLAARLVGEAAS